jgi:hypothetical protein
MSRINKIQNNNIATMDKGAIPSELIAVGVELIKLDKHIADKGIPPEDIEKIVVVIKNLQKS